MRPIMNMTEAREILLGVKEIFDNLKVKFWLMSGTCLGAVRVETENSQIGSNANRRKEHEEDLFYHLKRKFKVKPDSGIMRKTENRGLTRKNPKHRVKIKWRA